MSAPLFRKHLRAAGLLRTARRVFPQIPDAPGHDITLADHLLSGLAGSGTIPTAKKFASTGGKNEWGRRGFRFQ